MRKLFERADKDRDGLLYEDEFHFSTIIMSDDLEGDLFAERVLVSRLFGLADADRDGRLTQAEVVSVVDRDAASHDAAVRRRAVVIDRIWLAAPKYDADGDGALSLDEARALVLGHGLTTERDAFRV